MLPASWAAVWSALAAAPPPDWTWLVPCPVRFAFAAPDFALELLLWLTLPLSPGLSTRTEMFSLLGSICVDFAPEVADCMLLASCPAVCSPNDEAEAAAGIAPRSSIPTISARRRHLMSFSLRFQLRAAVPARRTCESAGELAGAFEPRREQP